MDQELIDAIQTAERECKNPFAQSYLCGITRAIEEGGDHGLGLQLLYCLNNMSGWRGQSARETKIIFKKYAKILMKGR